MPFSLRHSPQLRAAHFQSISSTKGVLFGSDYKRFKSEIHCRNVEEVIQLTEKLVQNDTTERELFFIRDGLQTLREGYEVTVQKDHPFRSFVRRIFPNLSKKHDQKVKLSIDHIIDDINHKIDLKEREAAGYNHLVGCIQTGEIKILSSSDTGFKNVQRLVEDPKFCKDAAILIQNLANAEGKSSVDRMQFIIQKIEEMKTRYGGGKIDHRELINAAIFAGRKHVPHLVNQLVKIRDDDYEVVFPPPGNIEKEGYNKYFEFLANGIQYCSQNELGKTVDLLHDKIADGVEDGFGPWLTGLKEDQSSEAKLMKSILKMKDPSFMELVREMDVFIDYDPKKSPEENLMKLTSQFDQLANQLVDLEGDIALTEDRKLTALSFSIIAEGVLIGVGLNSQKFSGGQLDDLQGFVAQLNNLLQRVNHSKLTNTIEGIGSTMWVMALLPSITNLSGVDLEDVYLNPPETKSPFEAKFSDYVRENMGRVRGEVNNKAVQQKYLEADKPESIRIANLLGNRAFRKEAQRFLKKVSRSSTKPPMQEMGNMRLELNRFAVRVNKRLPPDEKITVGELGTVLRAATLADGDAKRVPGLLIKIKNLIEREPELLNADPTALETIAKKFDQCKVFRDALDFSCRIDPKNLAESKSTQLERSGTGIEMIDFGLGEREYKEKISKNLEHMHKKVVADDFKSENKAIYGLLNDPGFVRDARNLYNDFIVHNKWAGTVSKSEQFGKQFQEFIVKKHAGMVGLNPKEISRQEEEVLLIVTAMAAREFAPELFSKFNTLKLDDFPVKNPAQMISYDMYNIVKTIGRGKEAFSSGEHPVLATKDVKENFRDVLELLRFKNSEPYQDSDKENVQYILALLENNEFKKEALDFVRRIGMSPIEDPVTEMQRMMKELSLFVERVNRKLPDEQRVGREKTNFALKAALLADDEAKYLYPLLIKVVNLIEGSPQLIEAGEKASEQIELAFQDFQMFRDAFDFSCRVDPVKLLSSEEEAIPKDSSFDVKIHRNLDGMKLSHEKNLSSTSSGKKNAAEQIRTLLNNPDFQEDANKLLEELLSLSQHAGTLTMMEFVGKGFHELIIKKHAHLIGEFPDKIGTDPQNDMIEAWLIAGKKHVPDFIRMFKGFDEDRMQKVDNNYKMNAFGINFLLHHVEQFSDEV